MNGTRMKPRCPLFIWLCIATGKIMREDEVQIAELISRYLSSRYPEVEVYYSPGEDPPDAYQYVGNDIYPLEITSTEVYREPIYGEGEVLERTYEISHREILRVAEKEIAEEESLIGRYAITFSKPLADHDFSSYKSLFIAKLKQVLVQLSSLPVGSDASIEHEFKDLAWVYKVSDKGSKLYEVFEDGALTESPEFLEFFCSLITRAIKTKIKKLSGFNPTACILAIRNTYGLADMNTFVATRAKFSECNSPFHTIFVIHGELVYAISSLNSDWMLGDA